MNQDFTNTYRLSDLILKLQEMLENHGDLPVVTCDPDTGYRMEIGVEHEAAADLEEWPERIEITSTYCGRPSGANLSPQNSEINPTPR
jgi:hypothetical protein